MAILKILGLILSFAGGVWLLITAFRVSILWGVVCLIPFGGLIFVATHWEESKEPFFTALVGTLIVAFTR